MKRLLSPLTAVNPCSPLHIHTQASCHSSFLPHSSITDNRWLQTERKVTILTMPMGTKRRQKETTTRLPLIKTALSTQNHYLKLYSTREEEEAEERLPPIESHHKQLIHFTEFARVNAHYDEKRKEFRCYVGKEHALQSQIEWRNHRNERQHKNIQLSQHICHQYSDDLKGSLHKMITSYAKGELKLSSLNARRYAEREDRRREEQLRKQFTEMENKLLWKLKYENVKIVNIIDFIHKISR